MHVLEYYAFHSKKEKGNSLWGDGQEDSVFRAVLHLDLPLSPSPAFSLSIQSREGKIQSVNMGLGGGGRIEHNVAEQMEHRLGPRFFHSLAVQP